MFLLLPPDCILAFAGRPVIPSSVADDGPPLSKDSATLEGYAANSIHANHSDMVKFGSAENSGFRRVLGTLMRWQDLTVPNLNSQQVRSPAMTLTLKCR